MVQPLIRDDRNDIDLSYPGAVRPSPAPAPAPALAGERYDAYFGLGQLFSLADDPAVFRVSAAGLALGHYLLRHLSDRELAGWILDVGTGSGALALLARSLGACRVCATDISSRAVAVARENEIAHFGDSRVRYGVANLLNPLPREFPSRFDLIVFNPPGWRAPSDQLHAKLENQGAGLGAGAMFNGDTVLVDFLTALPDALAEGGRAIVGFNSLVGIADVIRRSAAVAELRRQRAMRFKLLERHEIPLLFYTPLWKALEPDLVECFERWRREHRSVFNRRDDRLTWFYEITEVTHTTH